MIWRQMLGYVPVNLANIVISFGTIAILTRLFDGAEFGRYALAVATLHFVHMTLFSWVEAAMARFYARAENNGDLATHLKTCFLISIVLSVTAFPILLAILYVLPIDAHMKMVLAFALGSTCLTLNFVLGVEAHKAAHRIGRYSAIYSAQSLLGFSVGILLILMTDLREVAPFIGIIIANLCAIIIDAPFMLRRMRGGEFEIDRAKKYYAYGMPICFALVLAYILAQGDLFFIQHYMGDTAVGEYNAGYNLANRSLDVLFIWIGMAVTPIAVTALERDGMEKTKTILKNYGETLLLIILPAATGIALVAEPAGIILGASVREQAVQIMPWIAFAGVLNGFIAHYTQRAFMLSGNTGILAISMVPPVFLNITLNIWLIPIYGLFGAVWATIASYGFGLMISFTVARRYFPLPIPFKALIQIGFACLIMAGGVLMLPNRVDTMPDIMELLVKAFVGACVYGFTAILINAANCRTILKDVISRLTGIRLESMDA